MCDVQTQSKYWTGTCFLDVLNLDDTVEYAKYQREKCPTTGRLHWQFVFAFVKKKRRQGVQKMLGEKCHLEIARNMKDCIAYCSKDDTRVEGPFTIGELKVPSSMTPPHKRLCSQSVGSLVEERPNLWRNVRALKELKELYAPSRDFMTRGMYFSGGAGVGKSRTASLIAGFLGSVCYVADPDLQWFDPYLGEECAVFEETMHFNRVAMLLKVVDRYPLKVPVKGGFRNWNPLLVIFTSNIPMDNLLTGMALHTQAAVRRRIIEIKF